MLNVCTVTCINVVTIPGLQPNRRAFSHIDHYIKAY